MNNVTKKKFKTLTKTEQAIMVINSGKQLKSRREGDFNVKLYLLEGIFIEVYYSDNKSTITKIKTTSIDNMIQNYHIDKNSINEIIESKKLND